MPGSGSRSRSPAIAGAAGRIRRLPAGPRRETAATAAGLSVPPPPVPVAGPDEPEPEPVMLEDGAAVALLAEAAASWEDRLAALRAAIEEANRVGITSVQEAGGTAADLEVEGLVRTLNILAQPLGGHRIGDRLLHGGDGIGIFGADIDVAPGGAHGDGGDGQTGPL
mgnify:CR=1 FL=1